MKYQKGFTLIEVLVVITILGVMAAVGLTSYRTANMKARDSRRAADVQQLRSALEMYKTDEGQYPLTGDYPADLLPYLSGQEIVDPTNKDPYNYVCDDGIEYKLQYTRETGPEEDRTVIFTNP